MPRRPGGLAAVLSAALSLSACQSSVNFGNAGCLVSQQVELPPSALTLLGSAHLDLVGDTFGLSGVDDDRKVVRWATLDEANGALVGEHELTLPVAAVGPWLARTTNTAPGDTLLVLRVVAAATAPDAELQLVSVPATSGPAVVAAPAATKLAVIPGGLASGTTPAVVFAASRTGARAGVAWLDPKTGTIELLTLSAAGVPMGGPLDIDKTPTAACLGFAPGQEELTLVHYTYPDGQSVIPDMTISEVSAAGNLANSVVLGLDAHAAGCPVLAPTATGYAFAFEDRQGAWLGTYVAATNLLNMVQFSAAVTFGGDARQPPLVAVAPTTAGVEVVVARQHGAELWRLEPSGQRRPGQLSFPSLQGAVGGISARAVGEGVALTYADYTSVDGGIGTNGRRFFQRAGCE